MDTKSQSIGDRMKWNYELPYTFRLANRLPKILRIDGRCFHSVSRKLNWKKPYDERAIMSFGVLAREMCKEIMNVKLAYLQSDEISFLIIDYDKIETQPWFGNELQKICSIAAGIASAKFSLRWNIEAVFDARIFIVPPEEVCNYFIWRQHDATRNSIQGYAQIMFSQREISNLNTIQLMDKMYKEKNFNWDELNPIYKRGTCALKDNKDIRDHWYIDTNIPTFSQDRKYIEDYIPGLSINRQEKEYP